MNPDIETWSCLVQVKMTHFDWLLEEIESSCSANLVHTVY